MTDDTCRNIYTVLILDCITVYSLELQLASL